MRNCTEQRVTSIRLSTPLMSNTSPSWLWLWLPGLSLRPRRQNPAVIPGPRLHNCLLHAGPLRCLDGQLSLLPGPHAPLPRFPSPFKQARRRLHPLSLSQPLSRRSCPHNCTRPLRKPATSVCQSTQAKSASVATGKSAPGDKDDSRTCALLPPSGPLRLSHHTQSILQ